MKTNLDCLYCIIKKADERCEKSCRNSTEKLAFMKDVFALIGSSDPNATAPYLSKRVNDLLKEKFGASDDYAPLKSKYNGLMLKAENRISDKIWDSCDPLLCALQFAMVGNFIDFAAMDSIDPAKLDELVQTSSNQPVDMKEYALLKKDLENSKRLVYLLDNCGKIVFDKLFIKTVKKIYPDLEITAVVRGKPVFNDVTVQDAARVGLDREVRVIGNGTDIPGTQIDFINPQAHAAVDGAEVVISKGQGNFESLCGCGRNIYYIFLCKCDLFIRRFDVPKFTGMFVNERRVRFASKNAAL